jgi:hypothetical protein
MATTIAAWQGEFGPVTVTRYCGSIDLVEEVGSRLCFQVCSNGGSVELTAADTLSLLTSLLADGQLEAYADLRVMEDREGMPNALD